MRESLESLKLLRNEILLVSLTAITFIASRVAGMARNPELDDHDSNGYIAYADIWRSGDWSAIVNMNPDATFFYPFLVAVFSVFTGDLESAGRLVSLVSSVVALAAIYYVARRLGGSLVAVVSVFLVTINPFFIRFSYSVLTEPLYVALICLLLAVFIKQHRSPTVRNSVWMGLIGALAFLTRIEGILFLAAIPIFQIVQRLVVHKDISWTRVSRTAVVYVAVFTVVAAPQVWRVSHVMDTLSLNGRSVWSILLNSKAGESPDEKIYGLAFDPGITNLDYLQENADDVTELIEDAGVGETLASYVRTIARNLQVLHDTNLVALLGIPLLAFATMGFFALIRSGRSIESMLIVGFVATSVVAPLLHNVVLRHIAAIGPLISILAGAGIVDAGRMFRQHIFNNSERTGFAVAVLTCIVLASYLPGLGLLYTRMDDSNHEYDWSTLQQPARLLEEVSRNDGSKPRVMARKTYLPTLAKAQMVKTPFTDLRGLLRYVDINDVQYFYYSERNLRLFPFSRSIDTDDWARRFKTVYKGRDENGLPVALYAVRSANPETK